MSQPYTIKSMAEAIEDKLITLFLAESALSEVKKFIIGEPEFIPQHYYPVAILFITGQTPLREASGIHNYQYQGFVAVETILPEDLSPDDLEPRKIRITSYTDMRQYLDKMTDIVEQNEALGDLTDADGEVTLQILSGLKDYFVNPRPDGFTNRGEFQFSLRTHKLEA